MSDSSAVLSDLSKIPGIQVVRNEPLARHTRFALGGPADVYATATTAPAMTTALERLRGTPHSVIGEGSNLVVADSGYRGIVLRLTAGDVRLEHGRVRAEAGAPLQKLVDFTIEHGLAGLHTMTGIPGSVGAAIYGNAGAYGNSIAGSLAEVEFYDGGSVRILGNAECEFHYRDSIFKRHKEWVILAARLDLKPGDAAGLSAEAARILAVRNRKYPADLRCAGSIFKNLLWRDLSDSVRSSVPPQAVIEGKVPAAFFLEAAGAKGLSHGGIHVAAYHANLIYNDGTGTATELRALIDDLKQRVAARFGLAIEEEVQYLGF